MTPKQGLLWWQRQTCWLILEYPWNMTIYARTPGTHVPVFRRRMVWGICVWNNSFSSRFFSCDFEKTMIEMLCLCPGDNMSQHHWLGSVLICIGQYSDALFFAQTWLHSFLHDKGGIHVWGGTMFAAPSCKLISDEWEQKLAKSGDGIVLHTATLASFKLWGHCPQSCQYFKLAASTNPNVLLKVLACVSHPGLLLFFFVIPIKYLHPNHLPENLNNEAWAFNGLEEAHDYLWLTQDLWMESVVWTWANENPDVMKVILKLCSWTDCMVMEMKVAQFKHCSACHLICGYSIVTDALTGLMDKASYCGLACQREDWARHKTGNYMVDLSHITTDARMPYV